MDNRDTIRHTILRRMGELNWSTYRVAQLVKKEMCQATVYNFIEGMTDMGTRKVSAIMTALGLFIAVKEYTAH